MLQITITEYEIEEDIEETVEAIVLIERAQEILDDIFNFEEFEHDQTLAKKLSEISTILFTAHTSLNDSLTFIEL